MGLSLKDIDPVKDVVERLRLDREARSQGALVTEGPTDEAVLSAALGMDTRSLFPVGGRTNLIRVAEALKDTPLAGVVCVGDHDFDPIQEAWSELWWLVFYDGADLEAMLIDTAAMSRFLNEWASKKKLASAGGTEGVRTLLMERVTPFSSLRAANTKDGLGLPFDSVEFVDVIEKKGGEVKRSSLAGKLAAKGNWNPKALEEAMDNLPPRCPHTDVPLAKGRDLMSILSVLLRHLIGSLSKQQIQNRFVERSIRLAVRQDDLEGTPFKERLDSALARAMAAS